jgi:hypothetical protein
VRKAPEVHQGTPTSRPNQPTVRAGKERTMLVPLHRAVSAVLHIMLVAFVTLSARVQHGVLRSKHWFAPVTASVAATLLGLHGWMWLTARPNGWMW